MSLDIYAKLKRGTIPSGQQLGTCYRTWSREERDRLTDPTNEVLWINITHNLGKMASKVPITEPLVAKKYRNLYYIMWRPDEFFKNGWDISPEKIELKDVRDYLEEALEYLNSIIGDLNEYITNQIEAAVNENKMVKIKSIPYSTDEGVTLC